MVQIIICPSFKKSFFSKAELELYSNAEKGQTIHIVKSGIGPINAAHALSLMIEKYPIDLIILLGLGGSIEEGFGLSDVCIAEYIVQHDAICSYDSKIEQMACGEMHLSLVPNERPDIKISTDKPFCDLIHEHLETEGYQVRRGGILSGSEFNASPKRKKEMRERFPGALMVEMEACSVGYLAKKYSIPFCVVKTVADTLESRPSEEYVDFLDSSSKKCASIFNLLRAL